jgi:hypothetical protein
VGTERRVAGGTDSLQVAGYPVTAGAVGAVLVAIAAFLPWVSTGGVAETSALKVPVKFLVDKAAQGGGLKVGHVLVLLGIAGVVLASVRPEPRARRICGVVVLVIGALFVIQLQRAIGGWEFLSALGNIGLGVPVVFCGGVLLWRRGSVEAT